MAFASQNFAQRFAAMGDEAEAAFGAAWPTNVHRFGLDRPPISLAKIPPFIRYTPDFLTHNCLVEVQGCGNDQVLKLKIDKVVALNAWNTIFPTRLFVWDSKNRRYGNLAVDELPLELATIKQFPEGKPYYALPLGDIPIDWVHVDPQ